MHYVSHCTPTSRPQAKHDQAWVLFGRIVENVREVKIKRDEDACFPAADLGDIPIISTAEALIKHGQRVVPSVPKYLRNLAVKILVEFEPHYAAPEPSGMWRSSARSAA